MTDNDILRVLREKKASIIRRVVEKRIRVPRRNRRSFSWTDREALPDRSGGYSNPSDIAEFRWVPSETRIWL